jgi:hypothetical protein
VYTAEDENEMDDDLNWDELYSDEDTLPTNNHPEDISVEIQEVTPEDMVHEADLTVASSREESFDTKSTK